MQMMRPYVQLAQPIELVKAESPLITSKPLFIPASTSAFILFPLSKLNPNGANAISQGGAILNDTLHLTDWPTLYNHHQVKLSSYNRV